MTKEALATTATFLVAMWHNNNLRVGERSGSGQIQDLPCAPAGFIRIKAKEWPPDDLTAPPPSRILGVIHDQERLNMKSEEADIREVLEKWSRATREGRHDEVLANHVDDLVIFDVLPPMRFESAAEYRKSWDDWQPDAQGEIRFELEDLTVSAGDDVGFAFGLLQCGGTLPDGKTFRDTVRITFCLRKQGGQWKVVHQHVSKPYMK